MESNEPQPVNNVLYFFFHLACPVELSGSNGTLYNPGYPNDYPASFSCQYSITMDSNEPQAVKLTMELNLHRNE